MHIFILTLQERKGLFYQLIYSLQYVHYLVDKDSKGGACKGDGGHCQWRYVSNSFTMGKKSAYKITSIFDGRSVH